MVETYSRTSAETEKLCAGSPEAIYGETMQKMQQNERTDQAETSRTRQRQ